MSDKTSVLEMRGITKRFPGGTLANDAIDLELGEREIHALLGENGAGKTTLMNILYGLVTPDEGEIRIDGTPVAIQGPADAIARGIGMVHQHFMLVPVLSVAENVVLGQEITGVGGVLDMRTAERRIRELAERLGFSVDPGTVVGSRKPAQTNKDELAELMVGRAVSLRVDR